MFYSFLSKEKVEERVTMKYFSNNVLTLENTIDLLTTVKSFVSDFKLGRVSSQYVVRSKRPKSTTNEKIIREIHKTVKNKLRLKLTEVADKVVISAIWVSCLLISDQKLLHVIVLLFKF